MTSMQRIKETLDAMKDAHAQTLCIAMDGKITPMTITRDDLQAAYNSLFNVSMRAQRNRGIPPRDRMGW